MQYKVEKLKCWCKRDMDYFQVQMGSLASLHSIVPDVWNEA